MTKVKKYIYVNVILGVFLLSASCGREVVLHSEGEFYQWLNDVSNGLAKEKFVNNTHLRVKFLPADFLFQQQKDRYGEGERDSLQKRLAHSKTFVMTIGPDERDGKPGEDVVFRAVGSYKDYKEKLLTLNFAIEDYVSLKVGEQELRPVLSHLENVHGIVSSRKINFVFAPSSKEEAEMLDSKDLEFVFDDQIFQTGINHFVFKRDAINNIPKTKFTQHDPH